MVRSMKRLLDTALVYMVFGLASGLFYREYVKATDSLGTHTQLNTLHTHLLVLGMIMFLLVLALDAIFSLSGRRSFDVFYWTYNIGLVVTVALMIVRGILTDRKSTRLNSSHVAISYAVFCL